MGSPARPRHRADLRLIGRESESARLIDAVLRTKTVRNGQPAPSSNHPHPESDSPDPESDDPDPATAFLLLGGAGVGKSSLLDVVVARASAANVRVLSVTGRPVAQFVPHAGLRQLLTPLGRHVERVPGQIGSALRTVLDPLGPPAARTPDPALLRHGVLSVLVDAAAETPLLICVDDLETLDVSSRIVLFAVVGQLASGAEERVTAVFAQRGESPISEVAPACQVLDIGPLNVAQSVELLDRLPHPPQGRARVDVLRCAAGNPLALGELSRLAAAGTQPAAVAGDAVVLTDTLLSVFGRDIDTVPPLTRRALLLAAAGEDRLSVLEHHPVDVDPTAWEPAERAGLVSTTGAQVRFRHPLVQSAVLQLAGADALDRAHAVLASALPDDPGRRAWHLSAGRPRPDESVATELEAYADFVGDRGDALAAAGILQRAAGVSLGSRPRAVRLLRAAELAASAGQAGWVRELTLEAEQAVDDPLIRARAAALSSWTSTMADRAAQALEQALAAAQHAADRGLDDGGLAVGVATLPAYTLGSAAAIARLRRACERLPGSGLGPGSGSALGPATGPVLDSARLPPPLVFTAAVAAPDAALLERVVSHPDPSDVLTSERGFGEAASVGAAAYVLDESRHAVRQLIPVVAALRRGAAFTPAMSAFAALGWALLDLGRWHAAVDNAQAAQHRNTVARLALIDAAACTQLAIVAGLRGSASVGQAALRRAEAAFSPHDDPALAAHLDLLRSRVAAACDDHVGAWRCLTALFDHHGRPRHHHVASLSAGDLAAAAARAGHVAAARELLAPLLAEDRWRSARQRLIDARAAALLAGGIDAQVDGLTAVAGDPVGEQWPLERALTQLDLADLLRRSRRTAGAREALLAAIDTFERLGARGFEDRARRELRATGVQVEPARDDPLSELTSQQLQIVRMAAEGLTNREIGQLLFLSPRTVASHLYRAFPKLGIAARAQLPSLIGALAAANRADHIGQVHPRDVVGDSAVS